MGQDAGKIWQVVTPRTTAMLRLATEVWLTGVAAGLAYGAIEGALALWGWKRAQPAYAFPS